MTNKWVAALFASKSPLEGKQLQKIEPVSGGCIHQAWRLLLNDGQQIFAKTSNIELLNVLRIEAEGLRTLKNWANSLLINVPEPLIVGEFGEKAVLVLPWLELTGGDQKSLGQGLALIHQQSANNSQGEFGWKEDAFIGKGPQPGGWDRDWGKYFVQMRLKPQLKIASTWGLDIREFEPMLSKLTHFLNEHQPCPSIVHGDLWGGNASVISDGRGVLLDPATWWADREVDIAMTKLFGGFSKSFYQGYEEIWPLPRSAINRAEIYNLYHLINHANLFGGSYQNQCTSSLKRLYKSFNP